MATPRERHDPWHTDLTYIIGHQRPDMDAIASALGYAWFLKQTGAAQVVAARAGQVGAQAAFALGYFGTRPPRVLSSAAPTFGHVASPQEPVTPDDLLGEAMSRLAQGERLVPVVDGDGRLLGGLTPLALARAYAQVAGGLDTGVGADLPGLCGRAADGARRGPHPGPARDDAAGRWGGVPGRRRRRTLPGDSQPPDACWSRPAPG